MKMMRKSLRILLSRLNFYVPVILSIVFFFHFKYIKYNNNNNMNYYSIRLKLFIKYINSIFASLRVDEILSIKIQRLNKFNDLKLHLSSVTISW